MGRRWVRVAAAAVTVIASGALASCAGDARSAEPRGSKSASPRRQAPASPSQESWQAQVERHREGVLSKISQGEDAPDPEGLSPVSVGAKSTVFFWVTTDARYCFAFYGGTASALTCSTTPDNRISPAPTLDRFHEGDLYSARNAYGLIIAADRETVRSLSCGDERLAVRRVRVIEAGDATRTIYGVELDKWTAGVLRAEVVRADGRHTEILPLGTPADQVTAGDSWQVCD